MKNEKYYREHLVWEELNKSILRDYIISAKVSELEERIKKWEGKTELVYKTIFAETPKTISSEGAYKKTQIAPTRKRSSDIREWENELIFFNSIRKELFNDKTYKDKFVAIKNSKVIDLDLNNFRLVKRINKKYPNEVVLVVKVQVGFPVAEIPSPEVSL